MNLTEECTSADLWFSLGEGNKKKITVKQMQAYDYDDDTKQGHGNPTCEWGRLVACGGRPTEDLAISEYDAL